MKHFSIAYKDYNDNFCEICEYAERSDEAIRNAIDNIPILKNNSHFIFRCTNERDLECLHNMKSFNRKERDRYSQTIKGKFILKEIKNHIIYILLCIKSYLIKFIGSLIILFIS